VPRSDKLIVILISDVKMGVLMFSVFTVRQYYECHFSECNNAERHYVEF
jgi:hypothetical protein